MASAPAVDPLSIMRGLMPTIQDRVNVANQRRESYNALAERNAQINNNMLSWGPESQEAAAVSRAGGWPQTGMFDSGANAEYWQNNQKLAALQDLRRGGVNGGWRVNSASSRPVGYISGAGEAERAASPVQPGQNALQAIASLRKAAGLGG